MIKLYKNQKEVKFESTLFPDNTSQIWKIKDYSREDQYEILWLFEQEHELFKICQFKQLIPNLIITCPYLPYARQDKEINNESTFSLKTFFKILADFKIELGCYDAHSQAFLNSISVYNRTPQAFHKSVIPQDSVVVFPDLGATTRYKHLNGHPQTFFHKVRNQSTGEIQGLLLACDGAMVKDRHLYIVDDICDGGMTFIKSCEKLKEYKPKSINLVVSHGLFSKGTKCLYDAGITKIFTTNSLLRNNRKSTDKLEIYNILDSYVELPYNDGYEKRMV